jgi:hypothetical protein
VSDTPPTTFGGQWAAQFGGESLLKNTPGVGSAYPLFKDGWNLAGDATKGDGEAVASDITSTASDATSFASDAINAASDPLNFLISKGLGFLESVFYPLKEILQLVTGNPDILSDRAQKFDAVANSCNQLAAQVEQTAMAGGQNWQGDTAHAAGQRISATKQSIEETATSAGHIATLLQISGMLMQAAYDIVNGIIASVVEYVVVTWIAAQAAAPVTLGASEGAAMGATVTEVGLGAEQAGSKVEEATSLLTRIMNLLKRILTKLKDLGLEKFMAKEVKVGDEVVTRAGAGTSALKDISTEGKTAGQIFSEAMSKNLGNKVKEAAGESALGTVGLPGKSTMDNPESMDTIDLLKAGTNLANKDFGLGDKAGQAVAYSADPGAYTQYKNSAPAEPDEGGVQPVPSWPTGEPDDGNVEPI